MAQFKIYGIADALLPVRERMSDVVHAASVSVLGLPEEKRFHRFFPMDRQNFVAPTSRSDRYTIIEVSLFEGRTPESKRAFILALFEGFERDLGIAPDDLEITLTETPRANWGIRGLPGDELTLSYRVDV